MTRVLLTGGMGFLGGHLAKALLGSGYEVVLLNRRRTCPIVPVDLSACESFSVDDCDLEQVFSGRRIDAIIHCATNYGRSLSQLADLIDSNLLLPIKLMTLAGEYGVDCFVNSDSFFCDQLLRGMRVSDIYMPDYTLSKWQFTQWAELCARQLNLTFCNMQLQHVYGEYDSDSKFIPRVIEDCLNNAVSIALRNPHQKRDFIYVSDVVNAYLCVLKSYSDLDTGYNHFEVGLGKSLEVEEFVQTAIDVLSADTVIEVLGDVEMGREIDDAFADNTQLIKLGWSPVYESHAGNIQRIARVSLEQDECVI